MNQQKVKNIPTIFIIFGATGDLMSKKITPALFQLFIKGKFPSMFKIIGFSRRDWTDEDLKKHVRDILKTHKAKLKHEDIERFLNYFVYKKGEFNDRSSYVKLAEYLGYVDGEWRVCSNKLFYLAVPPQNYESIFKHLKSSGLTLPCGPDEGWTRVIVEKPFGRDLKTAERLDEMLGELFREEQIYRIDHYLGKEMLQNIITFRFSNDLFGDIWNKEFVEKIEVRVLEDIGVEIHADFYDGVGALRDVGQNHALQMVALVMMSEPNSLEADEVRATRTKILETLTPLGASEIKKQTLRAQYKEYKGHEGVSKNSKTETYFRVLAYSSSNNWKGVPIIIEGGKKIEARKEIVVSFKHTTPCVCPASGHLKNKVVFSLEPKEGISIDFWSKKPGLDFEMHKQKLNFLFRDARKKAQYIEEYEKLLLDCIAGNQLLFVSTKEVTAMWRFIDPIVEAWAENIVPLIEYSHGKKILDVKFNG